MGYQKILQQAIDLHVHIGPEIIPRKFTLSKLLNYEKGKLKGIGVKNHFFPTVVMGNDFGVDKRPFIINSIVLNRYVGGFNPDAIHASARLSEKPIIVWFPTLHSESFLKGQRFEIPKEWVDSRFEVELRPTENIKPLSVLDKKGIVTREVKNVLNSIKECNAILATGHLSWRESYQLVEFATKEVGLKKIIITHPIYQKIDMPVGVQKKLVKMGAVIEHCYSMYSIDKIPVDKIARQIKKVGANHCILSSDVGQSFSKSPSESLVDFIFLLEREGITRDEIKAMLVDNPSKLLQ